MNTQQAPQTYETTNHQSMMFECASQTHNASMRDSQSHAQKNSLNWINAKGRKYKSFLPFLYLVEI